MIDDGGSSGQGSADRDQSLQDPILREVLAEAHDDNHPILDSIGTCPGVGEWIELATGRPEATRTEAFLAHATTCSRCLTTLRACGEILAPISPPEEAVELANLHSTSAERIEQLAGELARTQFQKSPKPRLALILWMSSGAIAVMALAAVLVQRSRNHDPERLIAEAYAANRVFAFRIPGEPYTPQAMGGVRGSGGGLANSLKIAATQVDEQLRGDPSNGHLLELKARAVLLDERFDDAMARLNDLASIGPVTADLRLDQGLALYLRASVLDSKADRTDAIDYLRRADELSPDNPVIIFDEAIVLEDDGYLEAAVDTWNRYLKVESDPKWLSEGRDRQRFLLGRMRNR